MHRIDGPGHNNNVFTEGDPQTATPATQVTDDWLNSVQEEIAAVIEEDGGALDKADNTQLLTKIQALIVASQQSGIPSGAVITWGDGALPTGYLECNGAAINRTTYSDLFAVIGTGFGAGDGSTTFNLPDLRGEFIRGWDNSRGIDSGRALRSSQTADTSYSRFTSARQTSGATTSVTIPVNGEPSPVMVDGNSISGAHGVRFTNTAQGSETRPAI
ncbi:phage tail protein [Candidatus Vondammii sp. HM_W22]|uniref:phage tail protein n=1 Tax=Candidatus Vondammii sp. HM_W22 TaxID=2687299 RepID=UPI001F13FAFE|nr:phage tail protein [Candidatus Vondammii sp. HM_W22]